MPIKTKPDRRRISIDVTEELYQRINTTFAWGERNRVFTALLEFIINSIDRQGIAALGVFLRTGKYSELFDDDKKD